jgi:aryl-alcohol dehydrogenase-like predicted oxidoreductase
VVPQDAFGRTGHNSSRTIFGAAALSKVTQAAADRTLEVLLRHGVNHIDVAASYGDAELRIAPWLKREPKRFFLATKTGERTAKRAREELHRSLDRLGVDHVDLWQLHNLADPIEWDTALSPGGVIEAAVEARDQGLIKWIGVTGHGAQIAANHRRSLARFDFDSVLLPFNFVTMQLRYYAENFEALARTCAERTVAGPRTHAHDLVRAARRSGGHRPRRLVGARPARRFPQHRRRHRFAASRARRGGAFREAPAGRPYDHARGAHAHGTSIRLRSG